MYAFARLAAIACNVGGNITIFTPSTNSKQQIMRNCKNQMIALACAAVLAGCAGNTSYTINGSVEGAADGDKVYMLQVADGRPDTVAVADVKGGAFAFEGEAPETAVRYVTYGNGGTRYMTEVFLQPGDIEVVLAGDSYAKGTVDNDLFLTFNGALRQLQKEVSSLYNDLASCDDEQTRQELAAKMQAKEQEFPGLVADFVSGNAGSAAGLFVFGQGLDGGMLPFATLDSLYTVLTDSIKATALGREVAARYDHVAATMPGRTIKDFSMDGLDGKTYRFAEIVKGAEFTLVDFWASWCPPCMRAVPELKQLAKDYKGRSFQIVGVSLDSKRPEWEGAVKDKGLDWLQLSDLRGWECEAARLYNVTSIPTVMLVDSTGTIVTKGHSLDEVRAAMGE